MSDMQQGLLIAAIGMGLVFAVIIFLWGLMALIMRLTSREKPKDEAKIQSEQIDAKPSPAMQSDGQLHRAIAAAIAVRLVLEAKKPSQGSGRSDRASEALSPWQTMHRNRQIEQKRTRG